jgi:hypothetical protein
MAVAEQAIPQGAQGMALVIVAAFETGEGCVIALGVEQADGAQGFQVIMDIAQDVLIAFTGIPQQFTDGQSWETGAPMIETREGQEVVIDIGGGAGAGERPEEEEAVIDQIEGFGLVAEAVFAMRPGGGLGG